VSKTVAVGSARARDAYTPIDLKGTVHAVGTGARLLSRTYGFIVANTLKVDWDTYL